MAHTFNMGFPWNVTSQIHSKIQRLRYTGQVIKLNHHHFIEESAICVNPSFHYVKLSIGVITESYRDLDRRSEPHPPQTPVSAKAPPPPSPECSEPCDGRVSNVWRHALPDCIVRFWWLGGSPDVGFHVTTGALAEIGSARVGYRKWALCRSWKA